MCGDQRKLERSPQPLSHGFLGSSAGHQPCVANECLYQLSHLAGSELWTFKRRLSCGKIYVT